MFTCTEKYFHPDFCSLYQVGAHVECCRHLLHRDFLSVSLLCSALREIFGWITLRREDIHRSQGLLSKAFCYWKNQFFQLSSEFEFFQIVGRLSPPTPLPILVPTLSLWRSLLSFLTDDRTVQNQGGVYSASLDVDPHQSLTGQRPSWGQHTGLLEVRFSCSAISNSQVSIKLAPTIWLISGNWGMRDCPEEQINKIKKILSLRNSNMDVLLINFLFWRTYK